MEIKADKKTLGLVSAIVANMQAAGKLTEVRAAIWRPGATLALAKREEGELNEAGNSIVFRNLPKELAGLNGKGLRLKGKSPLVRICIAEAVSDWKPDEEMIRQNKDKGWKVPTPIKKGDQQIRCF